MSCCVYMFYQAVIIDLLGEKMNIINNNGGTQLQAKNISVEVSTHKTKHMNVMVSLTISVDDVLQ